MLRCAATTRKSEEDDKLCPQPDGVVHDKFSAIVDTEIPLQRYDNGLSPYRVFVIAIALLAIVNNPAPRSQVGPVTVAVVTR